MCSLIPSTYVHDHETEQTDWEHGRLGTDFDEGETVFIFALIYFGNFPDRWEKYKSGLISQKCFIPSFICVCTF